MRFWQSIAFTEAEHFVEVAKIAETTAVIRERLKAPRINASFDVLHSPRAGHIFSSGRLDFTTQEGRFLRLGLDDIGQEGKVDVRIAEPADPVEPTPAVHANRARGDIARGLPGLCARTLRPPGPSRAGESL